MKPEDRGPLLGITCREASRLISASLDRELTRRERWALRVHTVLCSACRAFARQSQWIREAISHAPEALRESWRDGATELSVERRAAIKRLLAEAGQADAHE